MFEERDLGPIYGFQWRHFDAEYDGFDKDYSEHFDIKNNKMINNAADYASKAQTQLDTKLNNPDRANIHFKEFKADWKKMGRAMNNPKFVEEQTIIYRDALSSRLFKEESPMFGNYMKSEDGLRLIQFRTLQT